MPKKKSVKNKKRKNNLGNGNNSLAPLRRGFAFVSSKAVLVRKIDKAILPLESIKKEYEQIVRTPFVVGRGFISRRFLCIYRLFSAGASPRPTIFPAGKPALWNAPLEALFLCPWVYIPAAKC